VWLITAVWVSLLLGASVVWPMAYGLDELAHVDMAYDYSAHPFKLYVPGQLGYSSAATRIENSLPGVPPRTRLALAPIQPRQTRPTLAQLGGDAIQNGGRNQMVEHPPLYYWLEAAVLRLPGVSRLAWDLDVWLMRLLSVVIMSPVPLLCWATARRLLTAPVGWLNQDSAARLACLAAALPLTIPNLIRDGASVDNDTLLILTTSVVLYLVSRVMTGDRSTRTALLLSVALAAALWTKGFALALPPIIFVAYLIGARHSKEEAPLLARIARPVGIVAIGALIGGAWWLRNILDYRAVQPNGFGRAYENVLYGPPDYHGTLSNFVLPYLTGFAARIWGEVGYPDSPSPGPLIVWGWFFVALIGVVAALIIRSRPGARLRLGVLALVPVAYFAITSAGSYRTFENWSRIGPQAEQGRYIYAGIVAIAVLFAYGWFQLGRPRLHARFTPLVVVGAIATNAVVWLMLLRSWYMPITDRGYVSGTIRAFHALVRWSPVPSWVTILVVGVLPIVTSVACIVSVFRDAHDWKPSSARVATD
jgi:4-amino-4-deoxy-L-arabinose transferase-like glycosyltransferase